MNLDDIREYNININININIIINTNIHIHITLIFIFRLRFPPGISIATTCTMKHYPYRFN